MIMYLKYNSKLLFWMLLLPGERHLVIKIIIEEKISWQLLVILVIFV